MTAAALWTLALLLGFAAAVVGCEDRAPRSGASRGPYVGAGGGANLPR